MASWLRKQPAVGEESLTDWLLYQLAERVPWIRYVKFTRHQEARETGADWEWWFVGRKENLGVRVQAKKLAVGTDNYGSLAYSNRSGMQIERLREDAAQRGLLSFYAFYADGASGVRVMCGGNAAAGASEGAFLADANTLYVSHIRSGRAKVTSDAILQASNPLSCLVCCPMASDGRRGIEGVYRYIRNYHPGALDPSLTDGSIRGSDDRPGIHAQLPAYVSFLLDRSREEAVPDWWVHEHRVPPETSALLLCDLRDADGV